MPKSIQCRNAAFNDELEASGWFTTPLLGEKEITDLKQLFDDLQGKKNQLHPFTLCSPDYEVKKEVFLKLKEYLSPRLNELFHAYRLCGIGFFYKASGSSVNAVPPHQDWTFVDETKYDSVNIWIPLMDVDKNNGAYHVIRGSHRWTLTYRGSNVPSACLGLVNEMDGLTYLPVKAGEAIVYNHRLIHATPPNISAVNRISIVLTLTPADAELIHCISDINKPGSVDMFRIDEEFFWKYTFVYGRNTVPDGYAKFNTLEYAAPDYRKLYESVK